MPVEHDTMNNGEAGTGKLEDAMMKIQLIKPLPSVLV